MKSGHHLALSLSRELWEELLKAALPVQIVEGDFDLVDNARAAVRQLGVRQRVAGLLEDRKPPERLVRLKDRAKETWLQRKPGVYRRLQEIVRVEGTYRLEVDDLGTELSYGKQRVDANAYLKGVAEGTVFLLRENVELPFVIEKRIGASLSLLDVRYDEGHRAVIGSLADLGVHIGDNVVLQLLSRLAEYALEQQLPRANPVPILKRDQVEEMVSPLGGPLKMQMGVEDLELEITEDDMTLRVRFGFSAAQLTDRQAEA
jgi:hypothetical protein